MPDVPHFSYPFRFSPSRAAVSEQDSLDEIADCVLVTILCPLGFRVELPEFGLNDPTFSTPGTDLEQLRSTVEFWEPRATAVFDSRLDSVEALLEHVEARISLRTQE